MRFLIRARFLMEKVVLSGKKKHKPPKYNNMYYIQLNHNIFLKKLSWSSYDAINPLWQRKLYTYNTSVVLNCAAKVNKSTVSPCLLRGGLITKNCSIVEKQDLLGPFNKDRVVCGSEINGSFSMNLFLNPNRLPTTTLRTILSRV